ncbi:MAG: hypothetical protein HRU19_31445 [Pseudobacteriovorax sp.]|nr:hypothetical protein [Pseudobacteriovorax sp.]
MKRLKLLISLLMIGPTAGFGADVGGGVFIISDAMNNGHIALPSNLESIIADQELPITELAPDRYKELEFDLQFRSTAPMPNDPHARAIRVGNSIISQDVDRFVTEVKTYEE